MTYNEYTQSTPTTTQTTYTARIRLMVAMVVIILMFVTTGITNQVDCEQFFTVDSEQADNYVCTQYVDNAGTTHTTLTVK